MKRRYNVFTGSGDWRDVWAWSKDDAVRVVSFLTAGRARIIVVEIA